jgi:hypothetical protein
MCVPYWRASVATPSLCENINATQNHVMKANMGDPIAAMAARVYFALPWFRL